MKFTYYESDYDTPHYKCEASTNETGSDSDEPQDAWGLYRIRFNI